MPTNVRWKKRRSFRKSKRKQLARVVASTLKRLGKRARIVIPV
jgi:hypothetical protein